MSHFPSLMQARRHDVGRVLAGALLLLFAVCRAATAQSPFNQVPLKVADGTAVRVGHYEPANMLRLAFALTPPHPAEQAAFLDAVQDPTSPLFHQFLSAAEWNERFGPSEADEQAVVAWAESQGLTVTQRYGNRLVVDVEAQSGAIEKALGVTIDAYRLADANGQPTGPVLFSNDREPVLPSAIGALVQSIHGLNSIETMHPASRQGVAVHAPDFVAGPAIAVTEELQADARAEAEESAAALSPVPAGYLKPSDIWSAGAYDYLALMNQGHCCNPLGSTAGSPAQSSIAIAAFGDVNLSDVTLFQQAFPGLAVNVTKILVDGGYTCANSAAGIDGDCFEATMDTEWSMATANSRGTQAGTAHIYIYEAPNNGSSILDVYNHMLSDGKARIFSTSWGCEELTGCPPGAMKALGNVLAGMTGQGWTLVAATGDQGATSGCGSADAVGYPGSDPSVVGAGGASLEISSTDVFRSETGWQGGTAHGSCAENDGGSTGGVSAFWPAPAYQAGMGFKGRAVPDLALNASTGQLLVVGGNWVAAGGTSIVAPMLAGFFAQENAYLLSLGNVCGTNGQSACGPIGNANYPLYAEGNKHNAPHLPFYDLTAGCNSNDVTALYGLASFCAKAGYDQVTGWGSANMLQLAWALNAELAPAVVSPTITVIGPAVNKWYNGNQVVSWTIADGGSGSFKGTGVAGFTAGWDAILPDAASEPNQGGAANAFYAGPQTPNARTGCLALVPGATCGSGAPQGCHTVHVRGWNNQGASTGDTAYGPVCYDNVAPVVTATVAGTPTGATTTGSGWYNKPPVVTFAATDPGGTAASGVAHTYYAVNTTACNASNLTACTSLTNATGVTVSNQGKNTIVYFAQDTAGNVSTPGSVAANYDSIPPVSKVYLTGTGTSPVYAGSVTVSIGATDASSGVAGTYYSLDGAAAVKYAASFQVATAGAHTLKVYSVDNAGNSETPQSVSFSIASPTTIALKVSPSTATLGQAVTLTAAVNGATSGTVTFLDGKTTLGTATLAGGAASFTTTSLAVGVHSLTAVLSPSSVALGSTSAAVSETVTGSATTTSVTTTEAATSIGAYVTFTVKVSAAAGPTPGGTVTLTLGNVTLTTGTLNAQGVFTFSKSMSAQKTTLVAKYAGTSIDQPSTSTSVPLVVP